MTDTQGNLLSESIMAVIRRHGGTYTQDGRFIFTLETTCLKCSLALQHQFPSRIFNHAGVTLWVGGNVKPPLPGTK